MARVKPGDRIALAEDRGHYFRGWKAGVRGIVLKINDAGNPCVMLDFKDKKSSNIGWVSAQLVRLLDPVEVLGEIEGLSQAVIDEIGKREA